MSRNRTENGVVKNEKITSEFVKLAGDSGIEKLETAEAIKMAREEGMDLVVVSKGGDLPVVKIMDYGKYRFDQDKKQKEIRKKQKVVKTKEIKIKPHIQDRDRDVKIDQGIKFLSKGHKVKVTMVFSGREVTHEKLGWEKIREVKNAIVPDHGIVESVPTKDGRNIHMLLAPR